MATIDQAIQQMLGDGMPPFPDGMPRLDTGRVVRYGPKRRAWYRLFEFLARNGRRYVSGAYGIWGQLESTKIRMDLGEMHQDERERLQQSMAALEARELEKRARTARFAANRARQQWESARAQLPDGVVCAYLERKGVQGEKGLRYFRDGTLLVPMIRYDVTEAQEQDAEYTGPRRMVGVQKIGADGSKRFNRGMAKSGAMCRLGKVRAGEPVLVAEGLATALSIRMALQGRLPVFVAFDAYNLVPAAEILRGLYPEAPVVFCADDDWRTEGNPGRQMAYRAADVIGNAQIVWPVFAGDARGDKETDFNDLHARSGLAAVAAQLEPVLQAAGTQAGPAEKSREAGAGAGREGGAEADGNKGKAGVEWGVFWSLVERFTLIYPSDTAYDHELGDIVALAHMKHKFGRRYVDMWLNSTKRRDVNMADVVFAPGEPAREGRLNLFRGFDVQPDPGRSCERLLALLTYLCGEEECTATPVTEWVLKWLAYPLQHLGAKMQTTLVMQGREGTGKNLFFGAVNAIYGHHGGLITQRQLESQFNSWMSAKLFLIANEVVTRAEMRHNVGLIKTLITEDRIWINRKQKDERYEQNHCNIAFFSNEQQPVQVGIDDRRFMVVKTPAPKDADYYKAVADEIAAGGVAALYAHLLALPLGDFTPHTKPLETQAKRDLIEMGMASPQLLWQDIKSGEVPVPYVPCYVEHIYRVYATWARRNGVKMPAQINRFIPDFMGMNGIRRKVLRVPAVEFGPDGVTTCGDAQRKVLLMGEPPDGMDAGQWVKESVVQFAVAADKYWGGSAQ